MHEVEVRRAIYIPYTQRDAATKIYWCSSDLNLTHLYSKQSHGNEADPAMQGVEVVDARLVVVVEHCQEPDDDARERQRMEDRVKQLHVNASEATADAVQQHGWK